jgi:hypothetical protein
MAALALSVRESADREQIRMLEETNAVFERQPLPVFESLRDVIDHALLDRIPTNRAVLYFPALIDVSR